MLGGPPRRLLEELTPLVHTPTKNNPFDLAQGADVLSQISADNYQIGDVNRSFVRLPVLLSNGEWRLDCRGYSRSRATW